MFTTQITHQGKRIVRLILIGRRLDGRTDDTNGENGKADNNGRQTKQSRVDKHFLVLVGIEDAPEAKTHQEEHKERGSHIVRTAQCIDKKQVKIGRSLRQIRDNQKENQRQNHHRLQKYAENLFGGKALIFLFPYWQRRCAKF